MTEIPWWTFPAAILLGALFQWRFPRSKRDVVITAIALTIGGGAIVSIPTAAVGPCYLVGSMGVSAGRAWLAKI